MEDRIESYHFKNHGDLTSDEQKEYISWLYSRSPAEIDALIARKEEYNEEIRQRKAEKREQLEMLQATATNLRLQRIVAEEEHLAGVELLNEFKTVTNDIETDLKDVDAVSVELKEAYKKFDAKYSEAENVLRNKYDEIELYNAELAVDEEEFREKLDELKTELEIRKESFETTTQKHSDKCQSLEDLKKTRIEKETELEKYNMPELLNLKNLRLSEKLQIQTEIKEKEQKLQEGHKDLEILKENTADALSMIETLKIKLEENLARNRINAKEEENSHLLYVNACKTKLRDEAKRIDLSNMAVVEELREVIQLHEDLTQLKSEKVND